jgi:hypothetical protein
MAEERATAELRVLRALVAALLRRDAGFCEDLYSRLRAGMFSTTEHAAAFEVLREIDAAVAQAALSATLLRQQFLTRMTRKGFPEVAVEEYVTAEEAAQAQEKPGKDASES